MGALSFSLFFLRLFLTLNFILIAENTCASESERIEFKLFSLVCNLIRRR